MKSAERPFKTLDDIATLRGRRVVLRASLNVPMNNGVILDDFRLERAAETIRFLCEEGARVTVLGHIGREPSESLRPVHEALKALVPIAWGGEPGEGEAVLRENVRSDPREVENDEGYARELAALGEIYINDAFADSHRVHASIVGIPKHLPSYAGRAFVREYDALAGAFAPGHPAVCAFGGAKFETKRPLIERFVREYDHVFVGGAIAHDFLKACGHEIGVSKVSGADLSSSPLLSDARIELPKDVVVAGPLGERTTTVSDVHPEESIKDAGPETIEHLRPLVMAASTVVWNGPLGDYEHGHEAGTHAFARLVAEAPGQSIVGGGDTVAAIRSLGLADQFDFISTAGGAMLQFLETETLPGIEALA